MYVTVNTKIYKGLFKTLYAYKDGIQYLLDKDKAKDFPLLLALTLLMMIVWIPYALFRFYYHVFHKYRLFNQQIIRNFNKKLEAQHEEVMENEYLLHDMWISQVTKNMRVSNRMLYLHEMAHYIAGTSLHPRIRVNSKFGNLQIKGQSESGYTHDYSYGATCYHTSHFKAWDRIISGAPLLLPMWTCLILIKIAHPITILLAVFLFLFYSLFWDDGLSLSQSDKESFWRGA